MLATWDSDKRSDARDRDAARAALAAHAAVMGDAAAAAEEEAVTLGRLATGDLASVHREFGARLNGAFGFELTYIVDQSGTALYSSEFGRAGEQRAFGGWLQPALLRALAQQRTLPPETPVSGVALAAEGAGFLVVRPFRQSSTELAAAQPLLVVVVDLIDPDFLGGIAERSRLADMRIEHKPPRADAKGMIPLANLYDDAPVTLTWDSDPPGNRILRQALPFVAVLAGLLCVVFFVLMVRARRLAAALAVSEARTRELAFQDPLTGLANRNHFIAELDRALQPPASGGALALFFIDLDGFKEVNDSAGHVGGDELLRVIARRLRSCIGNRGVAARFGGDEFVLFARCDGEEERESLVAALFGVIDIPVVLDGEEVRVSASMGAARAPHDADTASELMRLADIALYRAKAEGRGVFRLFEPRFEREQINRRRTEQELAAAIDKGELKLVYQPQVDVESERVVGFEVLVRWDHPTRGRILPSEFVPIAEGSRLIYRLDAFVLRTACAEAKALPGVTLSVNMSPLNLKHAGVVDNIMATLRETGFDPHRLEIEITESAIIDANTEGQAALTRLRELGVRLALDDFGTGHASLVHVRRFPITKIKIDKSFILNLGVQRDAASIVEYVVRLGRSLGITLTAEGVETREQLRFLRAFGAQQAQGYLFAPPLPLSAAAAMLERQRVPDHRRRHPGHDDGPSAGGANEGGTPARWMA